MVQRRRCRGSSPWRRRLSAGQWSWLQCAWTLWAANAAGAYQCQSDVDLGEVIAASKKGIALDDTTLWNCSSRIPTHWPNTQERVKSLRLFKAWDPRWPEGARESVWRNVLDFVKAQGAKLLVGAQITCNEEDDERAWIWTKELLRLLGPKHVMGLAVGNEMELLFSKTAVDPTVTPHCITEMWQGGYFWRQFVRRVADFDDMGFRDVAVTNVFGGLVLAGVAGFPFFEDPRAMVNTFLSNATRRYGSRYVFTLNLYPYFDPANTLDRGSPDHCDVALARCTCFNTPQCSVPGSTIAARAKIRLLTGGRHFQLWLGETGWSSALSASLATQMARCKEWSSMTSLTKFYTEFLRWDLSLEGVDPPDHVFYFTARDSVNFGVVEHFGLVETCHDARCKLRSKGYKAPATSTTIRTTTIRTWASTETSTSTTTTTPVPTTTSTSTTRQADLFKAIGQLLTGGGTTRPPFDCKADFLHFEHAWSPGKKAWCCLHEARACPRSTTTALRRERMVGIFSTTTPEAHGAVGGKSGRTQAKTASQAAAERRPLATTTEGAPREVEQQDAFEPYDCSDLAGLFEWSRVQRSWCCMIKGVGCPTTTSLPYDCSAGAFGEERHWSRARKEWCCLHRGAGCQSDAPDQSTSTSWPYDCSVGYFTWQTGWSPGKRAWCCLHEGLRCPTLRAPAVRYGTSARYPGPPGYDCWEENPNWEETWSPAKRAWCCEKDGRGCGGAHGAAPYSCHDGLEDWKHIWTYRKKEWCCRNKGLGCDHETVVFGKKFDQPTVGGQRAVATVPLVPLAAGALALAALAGASLSFLRAAIVRRQRAPDARSYKRVSLLEEEGEDPDPVR